MKRDCGSLLCRFSVAAAFVACAAASAACAQTAAERPAPRRALLERIVSVMYPKVYVAIRL